MVDYRAAVFIILTCYLIPTNTIFGKQMYVVTQIDIISYPGYILNSSLRLFGRDQAINGTMTILEDLNDDIVLQLDLFSDTQRNGEFKPMALELPVQGICSTMKTYYPRFIEKSFITNVHTDFDFKEGNICPLPKGTYWLKNIILEPTGWLNIMPTGFIKLEISLIKNETFGGGLGLIVNIQNALFAT